MDKIYYLVKRVNYALLISQTILNDRHLFGSMSGACNGLSKEMSVVFGMSQKEDYLINIEPMYILKMMLFV